MKKYLLFIAIVVFSFYLFGCGKKEQPLEEIAQEQMSMETLGAPLEPQAQVAPAPSTVPAEAKIETLPPVATSKPTAKEIQTALKNAGLYSGAIDGKIGKMTKTAIEEFQKTHGLAVDGKVGSKTWSALSKYLNPTPGSASNP